MELDGLWQREAADNDTVLRVQQAIERRDAAALARQQQLRQGASQRAYRVGDNVWARTQTK